MMANPKVKLQPYKIVCPFFVVFSSESLRVGSGGLWLLPKSKCTFVTDWIFKLLLLLLPCCPLLPCRLKTCSEQWLPVPDTSEHLALTQPGAAPTPSHGQAGGESGGEGETLLQHHPAPLSFFSQAPRFLLFWSKPLVANEVRGNCAFGLSGEQELAQDPPGPSAFWLHSWSCKAATLNVNQR